MCFLVIHNNNTVNVSRRLRTLVIRTNDEFWRHLVCDTERKKKRSERERITITWHGFIAPFFLFPFFSFRCHD